MPPISWTSKWRWPSVRLPASRQSANASGSRSSSGSPPSRARSRSSSALGAELGVVEQLHLGLDAVDLVDPPLVLLELAPLAEAKRAIDDSPCHQRSG